MGRHPKTETSNLSNGLNLDQENIEPETTLNNNSHMSYDKENKKLQASAVILKMTEPIVVSVIGGKLLKHSLQEML